MRIYNTFAEAINETQRDLAEMGTVLNRNSWQGKDAGDRHEVKELRNYGFTVQRPLLNHLSEANVDWCNAEFEERISGSANPGNAYKLRPEVWEDLLEYASPTARGRFAYTYNERMLHSIDGMPALWWLIQMLREDPTSRRAFLPIYFSKDLRAGQVDPDDRAHRVPCTLGYEFQISESKLHMTYFMRSSDFSTHFQNDLYLATKLMYFVSARVAESGFRVEPGEFTYFSTNLHVFSRDVEGTF